MNFFGFVLIYQKKRFNEYICCTMQNTMVVGGGWKMRAIKGWGVKNLKNAAFWVIKQKKLCSLGKNQFQVHIFLFLSIFRCISIICPCFLYSSRCSGDIFDNLNPILFFSLLLYPTYLSFFSLADRQEYPRRANKAILCDRRYCG